MPIDNLEQLHTLLSTVNTIALVGASDKPERPSHAVMAYLQSLGFRVFPVNPGLAGQSLLGETVYTNLASVPEPIDMVDVFLAPQRTDAIIEETIQLNIPILWLQIGVINESGAARAEAAGIKVVMNRCPKQDIPLMSDFSKSNS